MNVIITGASEGIGHELAGVFARAGHQVVVISRQAGKLEKLKETNPSGTIIPVPIDLATDDLGLLNTMLDAKNIDHIDILVHNAGYLVSKPFEELSRADWELTYGINVIGVAMLTKALLPRMGGLEHTHIVMIGSIGGMNGSQKFPGLTAYSSSKGALGVMAEVLAEEFRDRNTTVNCVALGSVQTEMLKKAFPGFTAKLTPPEISGYLFEFCLNGWRYFNGKILPVSTGNP